MEYLTITNVSCTIIIIVFSLFIFQAYKLRRIYKAIEKASKSDNILDALVNSKLSSLKDSYLQSINIETAVSFPFFGRY